MSYDQIRALVHYNWCKNS